MALTGHLSDLSLSELIEFFCNQRKTGQLKVLYPQGHGFFYLQTGSVVDARIGVLRGIDAVFYALTLPNAKFEFGAAEDPIERTINQPWTQVVLEGLRRLDEGVVPPNAFPPDYSTESDSPETPQVDASAADLESLRVPGFLSFGSSESTGKRKSLVAGAVAVAIIASVAALGVPAGWYGRGKAAPVVSQTEIESATPALTTDTSTPAPGETLEVGSAESDPAVDPTNEAALAAKRQRDRERAKARAAQEALSGVPAPANAPVGTDPLKAGPKKIAVTVTYDETGRVTQASGGDAGAVRIARQKRFPPGKAGSATITIPIN